MKSKRWVWPAVAACVFAAALSACGDTSAADEATPASKIKPIDGLAVPDTVLGMTVKAEDISGSIDRASRSYVDALSLFSMRTDDLLQATLQVSRFNENADYRSSKFRGRLLLRFGGGSPRQVRLGDDTVYLTTATRQQVAIWFRGRYMLVLASREEFDRPRTLVREMLKVEV